jgi:L-ascorbate metabolism protein UlaG (beta-lactamase superfamily)
MLAIPTGASAGNLPGGDRIPTPEGDVTIHPIEHATFVMTWGRRTLYVDPVGGAGRFEGLPSPDLILVTDIHGDHMDAATLQAVITGDTTVVAPPAVAEKLPEPLRARVTVVPNGMALLAMGLEIHAIPAYNLTPERLKFHDKGRGNGYVVVIGGKRIYISGDTEDIPEMRALQDIDVAFVCMNLPYTMTVEQAASAVREFKPGIVYPYHYRGTGGMSDVEKFKALVGAEAVVEVRLRDWYPAR